MQQNCSSSQHTNNLSHTPFHDPIERSPLVNTVGTEEHVGNQHFASFTTMFYNLLRHVYY